MKLPKILEVFKHFSYLKSNSYNKPEQKIESSPLEKFSPKEDLEEENHIYKPSGNTFKRIGAPCYSEQIENSDKKKNKKLKRNTIKLLL